jgi:hypothetical protein
VTDFRIISSPIFQSSFGAKLTKPGGFYRKEFAPRRSILGCSRLYHHATFQRTPRLSSQSYPEFQMSNASQIKEHTDVISFDRKNLGKADHLDGTDKIKLTKQSAPDGQHHHFIPLSWVEHVDQHVHLNKTGSDVTSHWQREGRG